MRIQLAAIGCALALASCNRRGETAKADDAPVPAPVAVRTARAFERGVERAIHVTGSLHPDETVSVSSEVAGRLLEIDADFGQRVRKGQAVAQLDTREFQLQIDRARGALAQAMARAGLSPGDDESRADSSPSVRQAAVMLEDARYKYENAARLVQTGDISNDRYQDLEKQLRARQAALDAARDELRTQLAAIQALRAELRLAEKRKEDATMRAPFDGAVAQRLASPGQYLKENTPVLTIVKTDPLRLRLEIPESAAASVRAGTPLAFTTDAVPGVTFRAVVGELNPSLDAKNRSLIAEARVAAADSRLRPGAFVEVRLVMAPGAPIVAVPRQAVYRVAGLAKVFVIRDGKAHEVRIAPGAEGEDWIEAPGLKPDDVVAVSELATLSDGLPVKTS
jgi:RND family efflux transporter MFP subunit